MWRTIAAFNRLHECVVLHGSFSGNDWIAAVVVIECWAVNHHATLAPAASRLHHERLHKLANSSRSCGCRQATNGGGARCAGNARSRHRMLAESARETTDRGGEHGHAELHDGGQRAIIAKHGVRGPPECAVRIGRMCQHPIRLQGGKAGQAVGGKYRGACRPITKRCLNSAMVSASAAYGFGTILKVASP